MDTYAFTLAEVSLLTVTMANNHFNVISENDLLYDWAICSLMISNESINKYCTRVLTVSTVC